MLDVRAPITQMLLSTRDAAKTLACSERTLYSLRKEGRIKAVSIGKSHGLRYPITELERFVAAQTEVQK